MITIDYDDPLGINQIFNLRLVNLENHMEHVAREDLWVVIYEFLFNVKVISYFIHNDGTFDVWKLM
jgi:hypothetical protein